MFSPEFYIFVGLLSLIALFLTASFMYVSDFIEDIAKKRMPAAHTVVFSVGTTIFAVLYSAEFFEFLASVW